MGPVFTLALKDLRLLVRDRPGLFFTVFFPVIFAVFFGTIFAGGGGDSGGIPIVVVDEDQTEGSRQFVDLLRAASELRVASDSPDLSPHQAADLVRRGKQAAYVVVPKGFGGAGRMLFWDGGRHLEFGVDPSRKAEAGMLEGILTRYAFQQMSSLFSDPRAMREELGQSRGLLGSTGGIDPERRKLLDSMLGGVDKLFADLQAEKEQKPSGAAPAAGFNPISIERKDVVVQRSGPTNSYALTFAQALLWGVAGCAASFGLSLVIERTKGTLVRLRVAPLSWTQVLASKALGCYIASSSVCVLLLLIARWVFKVHPTSMPLLAVAIACTALCFVGIMMVLAVLGRSESAAGAIGWAVILAMMMIGGGMVPSFVMPAWMQAMSKVSPVYWGILAAEGGLWRDFSPAEMLLPCGILAAIGVGGMALGVRLFKLTESGT